MKIKRDAFLYMSPKPPRSAFAQCATCVHFIEGRKRCELFGNHDEVTAEMSCGLYAHGSPSANSCLDAATPIQAGLVDRQVRCQNCRYFEDGGTCRLFELLNNTLPTQFDLNTNVAPHGCCNAQTP